MSSTQRTVSSTNPDVLGQIRLLLTSLVAPQPSANRAFQLLLNTDDTIAAVKHRLGASLGLHPANLALIHRETELDNMRTVGSYGLPQDSHIKYVVRLNTSRVSQPQHPLQAVMMSFASAPTVPLPPLPENGRIANRTAIRTNARQLLSRGIAGLGVIAGPNGTKRTVMLNKQQMYVLNAIRAQRAAHGLPVPSSRTLEEMEHTLTTTLAAIGFGAAASSSSSSSASSSSSSSSSASSSSSSASSSSSSSVSGHTDDETAAANCLMALTHHRVEQTLCPQTSRVLEMRNRIRATKRFFHSK